MRFGLKNAGATYQRMMQNCLETQIGRNMQVYVDNIVIMTRQEDTLLQDLREMFNNLNEYKIKWKRKRYKVKNLIANKLVFNPMAKLF